jgi:hypothetical protein
VERQGAVDPVPIAPQKGLPQGDPASPLRLTVIMAAWVEYMKVKVPEIKVGAYLDDRVFWARGLLAGDLVMEALRANKLFEQAFSMVDNTKKRVIFASTKGARKALRAKAPAAHIHDSVEVLGIMYGFVRGRATKNIGSVLGTADRRARRIGMAGGGVQQRRVMVQALLVSLFAWAGAWNTISKMQVQRINALIENALCGKHIVGRSRYILWTALTPDFNISFAISWATMRLADWRARRLCLGRAGAEPFAGDRLRDVLVQWGWTVGPSGTTLAMQEGPFEVGVDTLGVLKGVARRAWLRTVAAADNVFKLPENQPFM